VPGKLVRSPASIKLAVRANGVSSKSLKIVNKGKGMLHGNVSGPSGAPFSASGTGPFSLAPSASIKVTVQFAPSTAGTFPNQLTITSDDPLNPVVTESLTGIGK
jgi:hypothetical protein